RAKASARGAGYHPSIRARIRDSSNESPVFLIDPLPALAAELTSFSPWSQGVLSLPPAVRACHADSFRMLDSSGSFERSPSVAEPLGMGSKSAKPRRVPDEEPWGNAGAGSVLGGLAGGRGHRSWNRSAGPSAEPDDHQVRDHGARGHGLGQGHRARGSRA